MIGVSALFHSVFSQYYTPVFRYFSACFDAHTAEDLTQSLFAALWKQLQKDGFTEPDNWRAWIFRSAVNRKNDHLRQKLHRDPTAELYEETDWTGADEGEETDLRLTVQAAIRALGEADREILVLRQVGFTSEEMSELLGITASAARSRLAKAKQRFKEKLKERGVAV